MKIDREVDYLHSRHFEKHPPFLCKQIPREESDKFASAWRRSRPYEGFRVLGTQFVHSRRIREPGGGVWAPTLK